MERLHDEVVIVTGASRGLGRSMAERFAEEGARVVLTARDQDRLEALDEELRTESIVVPADVREADAVESVLDRTLEAFGRVDTLVNNAGVTLLSMYDERRELTETSEADWRTVIDVNLTGVFLFTRATLPVMFDQGRGNIINISSGLGRSAVAGAGAYVASKWGLEGLTRVTHLEASERGVNVNALDPGGRVDTDIWGHLPEAERASILDPDVMNEAAVRLATQGPGDISGESMNAAAWEERLETT
ncbi:MAG: SDR family NAD(P)-dependent oxidoreductase [Salinirussus sp.]